MSSVTNDLFGLSYASLTLIGGIIGFVKAGSVASLVASSVCASAILYGITQNQRLGGNAKIITAVSLLLLGFFGNKYRKSGKVMPGLVMTLYSLAAVVNYGRQLL